MENPRAPAPADCSAHDAVGAHRSRSYTRFRASRETAYGDSGSNVACHCKCKGNTNAKYR
jgi:hypothetical protein